ncbi:MAG TPA: hypothetical protein VNY05_02160 [Candidatus Acidoferrales bacterium]|nr:hypothetical protein [Candidatus Acidoferrales bacterium]
MFVGHLGVGLLARRAEPKISLGTWMLAVMLADFVAFPLLVAGVENFSGPRAHIAYSHSLLMDAVWAALLASAYYLRRHYRRGAWLLLAAVLSHWPLDVVSHRPDMPLAPGVPVVFGLGLWNSVTATLGVEGGFWLLAVVVYAAATQPARRAGFYGFWIGVALLTLSWYSNITRGISPNPVKAGVGGLIFFSLMVAWAYWMNRARKG